LGTHQSSWSLLQVGRGEATIGLEKVVELDEEEEGLKEGRTQQL